MSTSILLADDSPTIAKILRMALQSEPYEIRSVLTADDAVKELQSNPPYFFLVDLMLPQRDGYEFARWIRSEPKLKNTRIVLLSSAFEPVDQAKFESCGADALIEKPFDPSDLRKKLKMILEKPPKFPPGFHVTGALSGNLVDTINPAGIQKREDLGIADLSNDLRFSETDADGILSQFDAPQNELPTLKGAEISKSILLEFGAAEASVDTSTHENILDLAADSESGAKTTMLDLADTGISKMTIPAPFEPAPTGPVTPSQLPSSESLSPNAEALAAFFDAEIASTVPATKLPAPAVNDAPLRFETTPSIEYSQESLASARTEVKKSADPARDAFDASMDALDWGETDESSLAEWSNTRKTDKPKITTRGNGGSKGFDTGGSSFRFSENYIQRITKAFTGELNEAVPSAPHAAHSQHVEAPIREHNPSPIQAFSQHAPAGDTDVFYVPPSQPPRSSPSSKAPAGASTASSYSAPQVVQLSAQDKGLIEELIRKEVHSQVKEILEKVAWEVIPELAENLIKVELEKVLRELER